MPRGENPERVLRDARREGGEATGWRTSRSAASSLTATHMEFAEEAAREAPPTRCFAD
ncbi:MAG TPA: hypothetical protein VJ852_13025 [Gemmatimonadaceae bacterium]|nr:hypothetical protein [Gemmatimonadaceae bacterium]